MKKVGGTKARFTVGRLTKKKKQKNHTPNKKKKKKKNNKTSETKKKNPTHKTQTSFSSALVKEKGGR